MIRRTRLLGLKTVLLELEDVGGVSSMGHLVVFLSNG